MRDSCEGGPLSTSLTLASSQHPVQMERMKVHLISLVYVNFDPPSWDTGFDQPTAR